MTKHETYVRNFYKLHCKSTFPSFEAFLADIGPARKPRLRLTRKCVEKGYVPGNLVWAMNANRRSAYMVKTLSGNTAAMRAACEQDGIKYFPAMVFMKTYSLQQNPQAVYSYYKMDKNARKQFKRAALSKAVGSLV